MIPFRPAVLLLLSLLVAFVAPASAEEYDRYLLPVTGLAVPGANGSLWTTEFTIHNPRDQEMKVLVDLCSGPVIILCGNVTTIPPFTSQNLFVHTFGNGMEGAFVYVPANPNYGPTPMTLRARDLSKDAQNFGTEVRIAKMSDFAQQVIITDVPTDSRYRATLRIYNSSEAPRRLRVRVYPMSGKTPLIEEWAVDLAGINTLVFDPTPLHPGYAQIDPLTPAARATTGRVRIEIDDPLAAIVSPPPPPIWALVSITNNETQQVTTITPHP